MKVSGRVVEEHFCTQQETSQIRSQVFVGLLHTSLACHHTTKQSANYEYFSHVTVEQTSPHR